MTIEEYNKLTDAEKEEYSDKLLVLAFELEERKLIKVLNGLPKCEFDVLMAKTIWGREFIAKSCEKSMTGEEYKPLTDAEKKETFNKLWALELDESDRKLVKALAEMPDPPESAVDAESVIAEYERRERGGKPRYIFEKRQKKQGV